MRITGIVAKRMRAITARPCRDAWRRTDSAGPAYGSVGLVSDGALDPLLAAWRLDSTPPGFDTRPQIRPRRFLEDA